jgi:hypothetical protein
MFLELLSELIIHCYLMFTPLKAADLSELKFNYTHFFIQRRIRDSCVGVLGMGTTQN